MKTKRTQRTKRTQQAEQAQRLLITAAASALIALWAVPVLAQYRVGDDGRALDANNRVGSGGYNQSRDLPYRVTANQIVTGNVTDGKQFRGPLGYSDTGAFTGPTSGNPSDRFIRSSSGAPNSYAPDVDLTTPRPYYGTASTVAPPSGYVQNHITGAYVPAPVIDNRMPGDQRLGLINNFPPTNIAPRPGELLLPGPVDTSTQSTTFLSASPIYGVRQWDTNVPSDRYFLSNYTNFASAGSSNVIDAQTILKYRKELIDSATPQSQQNDQGTTNQPTAGSAQATPGQVQTQPLTDAGRLPAPQVGVSSTQLPVPGQFTNPNFSAGSADAVQGMQNRLLIPPQQQSTQFAELQRRFDLANRNQPLSDADANRQFQALQRAQQQGTDKPSSSNTTKTPAINPYVQTPATPAPGEAQPQPAPAGQSGSGTDNRQQADQPQSVAPLAIESLAKGIEAKGLANLLTKAEELMAQGQFAAALDHYDAAQQVAPNNPLILLGRADAELGAGFYARSEAHIREAILTDPAILEGQYNLKKFIGEDRLIKVVSELKQITQDQPTQTTPVFLLSWIAYNSGSVRQAAAYLDLAQKRVGRPDAIYQTIRRVWRLDSSASVPEAPNQAENNK